jgi:hypothetical protein
MSFEEQIKSWVSIDNQIKLHNEKLKQLRGQRNNITEKVTSYLEENSLEQAKIEITGGSIGFVQNRVVAPLSLKFVEGCLKDVIANEGQVEQIMNYIKEKRDIKYTPDLRRVYDKE